MIAFLLRQYALEAIRGTATKDGGLRFTQHLAGVVESLGHIQDELSILRELHGDLAGKGRFNREFDALTDEVVRVTQVLSALLQDAGDSQMAVAFSKDAVTLGTLAGKTNADAAFRLQAAMYNLLQCVKALTDEVLWSPPPAKKRSLA